MTTPRSRRTRYAAATVAGLTWSGAANARTAGRLPPLFTRPAAPACVTVTLLDGLVLARSAFHHSMNYRSVVILGTATAVVDRDEKLRVLNALVEHVMKGRSADARPPSEAELNATMVLRMPITEASAKIRTGPPLDD